MTSFAIESSAKWVGKLLLEEVESLGKVRDKVEGLQSELEWMNCFLLDADQKQYKEAIVRKCISDIRDLAQEVEDVIELYILKVSHKREKPRGLIPWTDLKWLLCCLRDAKTLHGVGHDIDTITAEIHELTRRLQTYGILNSSHDPKLTNSYLFSERGLMEQRRTYSHTEDDDVVGLDEHVNDVADKLVNGQQKVVVIHGMGGIGKTTLAREVYHHAPLKTQFESSAWAYVSQQLQLGSICRDILLIPSNDKEERKSVQESPDSQLPTKLYNLLKRTRSLVVLDDIWSVQDWDRLKHAFPLNDNYCNSKLLVTTRNSQIFSGHSTQMVYCYEAKLLNSDRSWEVFQKKTCFNKENAEPWMVELGEMMLSHCNGHPLAIVVLGGVLATKKTLEEWRNVSDDLGSNLQGDGRYSGVYEILALSYYDLPYHLKACFLNLGYFPEDFEIPAQSLYHLWMVEGIVSSTQDIGRGKRLLGGIAKGYLDEMVLRGMVQVASRYTSGDIESCKLHDPMRDNFLRIVVDHSANVDDIEGPECSSDLDDKLRRLAIYVGNPKGIQPCLPDSSKVQQLRSLLFFANHEVQAVNCEWINGISNNFQLLRVLDFTGLEQCRGKLPASVGTLMFLRYLSIKDTHISELPPEIGKLRSLLILDLRVKAEIKLHNVFCKLQSLRQLYLPLNYEIEKMTLCNLSNLQKIEGLDLDRVEVEGLQELARLQRLTARCMHKKEGLYPFLRSSTIKRMSLTIGAAMFVELSNILSGCHFLVGPYIAGRRGRSILVPMTCVEMIPPNLEELGLGFCEVSQDCISALEKLPLLRLLWLFECYKGSKLHISSDGFPELIFLLMCELRLLREWTVERGGLPKLKQLSISGTPVEVLPDALPPRLSIGCDPCVPGIERYGSCPWFHAMRS
ncbi:hypothetical protein Cgig2_011246 [Carnegiea gigantea]|uniref:Uncharacterized protein n=1 Tax=Carnegiea gigantea TaxID=171969 RepID=A0A9Q1KGB5_9CARY|nr:hypothetical protein Cgig2_011246 [Carnegiea gigantea]